MKGVGLLLVIATVTTLSQMVRFLCWLIVFYGVYLILVG